MVGVFHRFLCFMLSLKCNIKNVIGIKEVITTSKVNTLSPKKSAINLDKNLSYYYGLVLQLLPLYGGQTALYFSQPPHHKKGKTSFFTCSERLVPESALSGVPAPGP